MGTRCYRAQLEWCWSYLHLSGRPCTSKRNLYNLLPSLAGWPDGQLIVSLMSALQSFVSDVIVVTHFIDGFNRIFLINMEKCPIFFPLHLREGVCIGILRIGDVFDLNRAKTFNELCSHVEILEKMIVFDLEFFIHLSNHQLRFCAVIYIPCSNFFGQL